MQIINRFKDIDNNKLLIINTTLLLAIFIGILSQDVFFPELAVTIRDITGLLFYFLDLEVFKYESQMGIGLAFPEFNNKSEIIHGTIIAECLGIPILACYIGYLSLITFYYQDIVLSKNSLILVVLKYIYVIISFLLFTILRYFLILFTFICLWDTNLWSWHYFIGHDIVGNLVQLGGILCFLILVYKILSIPQN